MESTCLKCCASVNNQNKVPAVAYIYIYILTVYAAETYFIYLFRHHLPITNIIIFFTFYKFYFGCDNYKVIRHLL